MPESAGRPGAFSRGSWLETRRISEVLRSETSAGMLLIGAALLAMIWANSPVAHSYFALRELEVGPPALHLSLQEWAADGLLALFFFLAGLELKREFVVGDLRDPRRAAVPVAAALGGMVVPALLFLAVNAASGTTRSWAIPIATDIAFSLAVLAVVSTHLPAGLRTFLLALAIVDDLLAITVIAVFFTADLHVGYLALALMPLAAFGVLAQLRVARWWIALRWRPWCGGWCTPPGCTPRSLECCWRSASRCEPALVGVAGWRCPGRRTAWNIGCARSPPASPCRFSRSSPPGSRSAGFPRTCTGWGSRSLSGSSSGWWSASRSGCWLARSCARGCSRPGWTPTSWWDTLGVALLCGMGFTVALLIGELAFQGNPEQLDHARIGVITGTLLAAVLAAVVLRLRNQHYREIEREEAMDTDHDGVPDVFDQP